MAANTPKIITEALSRLDNLVSSAFFRRGRSRGYKAMKSDRAANIKALLIVLLKACCMEFQGALCRVAGNLARPLTVPEMSEFSKRNQRTIERCMADLEDLGLVHSKKQFMRMFPVGLKVAAVWRVFTQRFWEKLGLWGMFVESVKYAAQHAHLKLKNPLKLVSRKKAVKMSPEEARRRKRELEIFPLMAFCEHRKHEKACSGCHQAEEVCALCRRLSL